MIIAIALALFTQADIAGLASPLWAVREAAERRLDVGPVEASLPCLASTDPEVFRRAIRSIRAKAPCVTCGGSGVGVRWLTDWHGNRCGYEPIRCTGCEGWGSKWLSRRMNPGRRPWPSSD